MKRLEKQFAAVSNLDPDNIAIVQKQNIFHWEVSLRGPAGSPFEGEFIRLSFDFPEQFPFKFPVVQFRTHVWHPNVKDGNICSEMIGEKQWQPNKKVTEIIMSLQSMLAQPDLSSAINLEAAKQFKEGKYEAHAREFFLNQLKKQQQK